ncbi:hypothetical protein PSV08DRAFT_353895 [Bipolaris maydis]|uniref:uncharacterized protein n=1 Tax=Cochliobolus heterostrophus TaxID=5016 RepID=UPI0024DC4AD6|nr:hypothetical protein J3E74DRAFT_222858 [Bipolaris maydis]KAJ6268240.1 hypothetical protein PSV08DRAFT_353895 [Bipolaris maydis]KAJ6278491.1 hypothetical protein J3E71DRAFT_345563 [Bipolaris maydis]
MSTTALDGVNGPHQRWMQIVEEATPSHLPIASVSKQTEGWSVNQLHVKIPSLQAGCEQSNTSPLELIKASWAGLLRCYTGSEDILFAGIGLSYDKELKKWANASICRVKLRLDDAILLAMNKMQQVAIVEPESSTPFPDAFSAFATLVPKPFNSAIWQRRSSYNRTGELSDDEIFKLLNNSMA